MFNKFTQMSSTHVILMKLMVRRWYRWHHWGEV